MNYHLNRDGVNLGVFPLEELRRRMVAGELTGGEMVWTEGMAEWRSLESVLRSPNQIGAPMAAPLAQKSSSRKTLIIVLALILAKPFRQPQQYRSGLGKTNACVLQHRNFAHLVDARAPLRRPRDATAKIGPDRLELLTAKRKHEGQLVAVSGLWKIVQSIGRHFRFSRPKPDA